MIWRKSSSEQGQAIVEFVIVFPVQLLFTLGIMQLSLLYIAKQMTEYAAFQAARVAWVFDEDKKSTAEQRAKYAAALSLAPISLSRAQQGGGGFNVGGEFVRGSGSAMAKTEVKIDLSKKNMATARVTYDFEYIMPVIGPVLANPSLSFLYIPGGSGGPNQATRKYGSPHVTLYGYVELPRPW